MISSKHRFHGHNSLSYVYRHGALVRGPLTSLKFAPNDRRQTYRLAVVVSKKVSKLAVVRNQIRRRLYEAFRLQETLVSGSFDIVITVFSDALLKLSSEELHKLVNAQLYQAHIISSGARPPQPQNTATSPAAATQSTANTQE